MNIESIINLPNIETIERPWGSEIILGICEDFYSFKLIRLEKGEKGGLQYHHKKDEMGILIKGKLLLRFDQGEGLRARVVKPGGVFRFTPGFIHQEEALEDCEIIEVSTPFFNDRVRCEHLYGLEVEGLPSTEEGEVIINQPNS